MFEGNVFGDLWRLSIIISYKELAMQFSHCNNGSLALRALYSIRSGKGGYIIKHHEFSEIPAANGSLESIFTMNTLLTLNTPIL